MSKSENPTIAKIEEAEILAIATDEVEMLTNELLAELGLRTVRNLLAFRSV